MCHLGVIYHSTRFAHQRQRPLAASPNLGSRKICTGKTVRCIGSPEFFERLVSESFTLFLAASHPFNLDLFQFQPLKHVETLGIPGPSCSSCAGSQRQENFAACSCPHLVTAPQPHSPTAPQLQQLQQCCSAFGAHWASCRCCLKLNGRHRQDMARCWCWYLLISDVVVLSLYVKMTHDTPVYFSLRSFMQIHLFGEYWECSNVMHGIRVKSWKHFRQHWPYSVLLSAPEHSSTVDWWLIPTLLKRWAVAGRRSPVAGRRSLRSPQWSAWPSRLWAPPNDRVWPMMCNSNLTYWRWPELSRFEIRIAASRYHFCHTITAEKYWKMPQCHHHDPLRPRPVTWSRHRASRIVSGWSRGADRAMPEKSWHVASSDFDIIHTWTKRPKWPKDMKRVKWSWVMCSLYVYIYICSILLRIVHSLCSIIWAQTTFCISTHPCGIGSQDDGTMEMRIKMRINHGINEIQNQLRTAYHVGYVGYVGYVAGLVHEGRCLGASPVPMTPRLPLGSVGFLSISRLSRLSRLQVRTNARASDLPPFSELVSQSTTLVQLRHFQPFHGSSCRIHLHKCAHCWFIRALGSLGYPCNTTGCMMLADADFACLHCMCLHNLLAWCGPPIQLLTAAKRMSPLPSSIWKWMPPSVACAACAACFFNTLNSSQNPLGSTAWTQATHVQSLQSLQSLQSHHLGSRTSIFSLANARTGRIRPLPDPTDPTDPAPTSAWRSDEDQKISYMI